MACDLDGLAGLGVDGRCRDKRVAIGLAIVDLVLSRDAQVEPLGLAGLTLVDHKREVTVHSGIVARVLGLEHGECGDNAGVLDLLVIDAPCP